MSSLLQPAAPVNTEELLRNREHLHLLLRLNNALISNRNLHDLVREISATVTTLLHHDYASLCLYDQDLRAFRISALSFPSGTGLIHEEIVFKPEGSPAGKAFAIRKPLIVDDLNENSFPGAVVQSLLKEGIHSACWVPLLRGDNALGVLCIGNRRVASFPREQLWFVQAIAGQVAIAVENATAFERIRELTDQLASEKNYLEEEIRADYNYEEMVGQSCEWKNVLEQIETVARTDATVLILGETGTGKELVARAIHDQSARNQRTFVKLNCSAVPTGLLESELFGHERGAFTGAIAQRVGRFELAHKGTLLLDEIGDIALDLQPKLLRALQEQQFERLGSSKTITVDVRVIASTNRHLQKMVENREFRDDLYYRLNVFPIAVPALRDRRTDIPLLARYFVQKYAVKMRKRITDIPKALLDRLLKADWPGNIRQLENFIERAVILSQNGTLSDASSSELSQTLRRAPVMPLDESERTCILNAIRECHGVIGGANGAAVRLCMKRTTLNSKMRKLGISRDDL